MIRDELASLEYEALQAEKRDKMTARLQVWSLFIGLVGAFGLASLQSGTTAYLVGLYPLLAACVARYAGHSEAVLDKVKAYLLEIERQHAYAGYEHFNRACQHKGAGGHLKALRDAIVLTDMLASIVVVARLVVDGLPIVAGLVAVAELVAIIAACLWLRDQKARPKKRPRIVCLCGSTRFSGAFREANLRETLAGHIVLTIGCDTHSDSDLVLAGHAIDKAALDQLHLHKIDLADEVFILNVGGYIGESTAREIEHAWRQGKYIRWLEHAPCQ